MEGNIAEIAESFGLKPHKINKSKYFYILSCREGQYRLYSPSMSVEDILILANIKACLTENNISTDKLVFINQLPYIIYNEQPYIALKTVDGNCLDFGNKKQLLDCVYSIGCMNRALMGITPLKGYNSHYTKGAARLKEIKSIINRKNKPINVDVLFMKNYKLMYELCNGFANVGDNGNSIYLHGSLKEENIIFNKGFSFINWNGLNVGNPLKDLAYFINRYVKKYALFNQDYVKFNELVGAYSQGLEQTQVDLDMLRTLVLFPEKYVKIVDDYYSHPKTFTPVYIDKKLNECRNIALFLMDYVN